MASENDAKVLVEEFLASWDRMEKFYEVFIEHSRWAYIVMILGLIKELRQRGYDRQFRAGQSLATFILSRSRRHGLRRDQANLKIDLNPQGGMSLGYYEPPNQEVEISVETLEVTPEVETLLQCLLSHPID
jgi:hypothetical protein